MPLASANHQGSAGCSVAPTKHQVDLCILEHRSIGLKQCRVERSAKARLAALLCLVISAAPCLASAQPFTDDEKRMPAAPVHEQVLTLPGDPSRPVTLEVTLFEPSGPGPFPLAVMNHGATNASGVNRGDRYRFTVSAYYFLSRGYAVALPMMRGFAQSGGDIVHAGCDLAAVADANARDIAAVTAAIERRPEIDRSRVVVAGQSFGAWNTLGVGADPPPGVKALVLFNAALRVSDCSRQDEAMIEAAASLGARARLPSLWLYGDNDKVVPNATWGAMVSRYGSAGGKADLSNIGSWGTDSHEFLSDPQSLPRWAPRVDAFLARYGLPGRVADPGYLPHPTLPATNFAALADIAAVPGLSESSWAAYRQFLNDKLPRAFVIALNGGVLRFNGGYDPLGLALRACARAGVACQPYAVDDAVVWAQPAAARTAVKTVQAGVPTLLGAFFELNPDCSPRELPRVDVTAPPAHGTAIAVPRAAHPAFPANSPFAACNGAPAQATGLTYTAAVGYSGSDTLDIVEITATGRRQTIHISLTVVP